MQSEASLPCSSWQPSSYHVLLFGFSEGSFAFSGIFQRIASEVGRFQEAGFDKAALNIRKSGVLSMPHGCLLGRSAVETGINVVARCQFPG